MFRSIGPVEIGIILIIILIIFGVGKLPQIGGAIGKGIHEFRRATRGESTEEKTSEVKSTTDNENKTLKR
jgi:sec-independent protein translocase protein TatA